jgi:TatA/E family protein of Tat protein translocase
MGPIGMPELIIILVIALIIFGPRKLPELGKSLGKSLNEFKRASADLQNTLEQEIKLEEQKEQSAKVKERIERDKTADIASATAAAADTIDGHATTPEHETVSRSADGRA